ncbi:ribosome biogenesis protein ytm1 [Tilletia horrida]|uniref:Ribosome biogenesis protein YTM1 n=1 Tax=Tilletia horrida TaxID=155126 RepID=A0AAN6JLS4_9BASI|nr:ribosome biogenesis protein ytm1 [Tilletia horrida]
MDADDSRNIDSSADAGTGGGGSGGGGASTPSVPVLLRTTHAALAIPLAPYMVPVSWRRSHLSTLVNRILQPTTPTPLDFIVDGQLLRTSLAEYLESAGKDIESTVELLYVPSTLPPKYEGAFEHDDWVASVDARGAAAFLPAAAAASTSGALLLTASYDGAIRVWSHTNVEEPLLTFNTSSSAAGSLNPSLVDALWTSSAGSDSAHFATAGMDGVVRAWSVPLSAIQAHTSNGNGNAASAARPRPLWTGPASLTSAPLSSLHTTTDGEHILAAAWDGTVSLWAANPSANEEANAASAFFVGQPEPEDDDEDGANQNDDDDDIDAGAKRSAHRKKRKTLARTKAAASALTREPLQVMSHVPLASSLGVATAGSTSTTRVAGPNSKVSRAIFAHEPASSDASGSGSAGRWTAFSAGWDGSVREWDLGIGGRSVASKSCDKVLLTIDQLRGASASSAILLTGHMDRSSAVWDMRSDVATPTLVLPGAHTAPVSSLRTHPTNANLFATGSHDGTLKLWDIRSPRTALFGLTRPAAPTTAPAKGSKGSSKTPAVRGKGKILALDWDSSGKMLFSGGDDCRLSVHRGESMDRTGEAGGVVAMAVDGAN